jgi:hypothetical protein
MATIVFNWRHLACLWPTKDKIRTIYGGFEEIGLLEPLIQFRNSSTNFHNGSCVFKLVAFYNMKPISKSH